MLFSFIISLCISFAVFIFSHLTPLLYKGAKNRLQRIIVLGASLLLVTGLFIALAIFRSTYLALHNVHVNPFYFVIINLFFFTVSSLLSFFVLPTWQEIKQNAKRMKLYHAVIKRNKEIERIKGEKIKIREVIMERTKQRVRIINCINYAADRFRKMYKESIAVFKRTNLAFRTDRETPDCFSQMLPEADINEVAFHMNKHS